MVTVKGAEEEILLYMVTIEAAEAIILVERDVRYVLKEITVILVERDVRYVLKEISAAKCFYRTDLNCVPNISPNVSYTQNTGPYNTQNGGNFQGNQMSIGFQSSVDLTSGNQLDYGPDCTGYPNSGANNHVTFNIGNLNTAADFQGDDKIHVGNGTGPSNRNHTA